MSERDEQGRTPSEQREVERVREQHRDLPTAISLRREVRPMTVITSTKHQKVILDTFERAARSQP